jgi:hypothetical protein
LTKKISGYVHTIVDKGIGNGTNGPSAIDWIFGVRRCAWTNFTGIAEKSFRYAVRLISVNLNLETLLFFSLDVLLAALSDTLAENPELLTAARIALGGSLKKVVFF